MKIDRAFALEAYSHPGAVRGYSRIGLWKSERAFFTAHLPRDGRILDLGCGAGRTTFALYEEGYRRIVGADLSPVMIRQARSVAARRRVKIRFRVGDACRLPFPAQSFDGCLFSFNGLMTIPRRSNRIAALREIRRILVPGGMFVFTSHERPGPAARWRRERALWKSGRQDPRLHEFGDEVIEELGRPTFIHVPDRREVLDSLRVVGLQRVEDAFPGLARESRSAREFIGSGVRFWAVKR